MRNIYTIFVLLLLTACATPAPQATATSEATATSTPTAVPTFTPTPAIPPELGLDLDQYELSADGMKIVSKADGSTAFLKGQDWRWILYPENLSSEQVEFLQGRDLTKTPRLITSENASQFGLPVGSQLTFLSEGWWGYVLKNSLGELVAVADVDDSGIKQHDILKYKALPSIDTTPEQCPNCVLPLASIAVVATVGSDGEVVRTDGEVNLAAEIAKLNGPIAPNRKVTPGKVIRVDEQYMWDAETAAYYEAHPDEVPYQVVARFYASDDAGIRPVIVFAWWRFDENGKVVGLPAYVTNVYRTIDRHWDLPSLSIIAMPTGHYEGPIYLMVRGKYTDKVNPLLVLASDAGLNAALDLWQETGNMPSSTADGRTLVTVGNNVRK